MADYSNLPDFDSLPPVKDMPQGCVWGLFDKNGEKDKLGCLNLLTPSVVQAAFKEARDGHSVSLNWPIGAIKTPGFGRKGLVHKTFSFEDTDDAASKCVALDDEVEFNTQCSSQWDSLVHFAHQPSGLNYNGHRTYKDQLAAADGTTDLEKTLPTLTHWHERGGLVARGVLLDFRAWAHEHGREFGCFSAKDPITTDELEKVAAWEGVELRQGDVIIIRTGFTEELGAASGEEQANLMSTHQLYGVLGSKATAKWFWNHHPAAVAGDAIAFEQIPPRLEDGTETGIPGLVLHQWFLSCFGLPIGELWDLKRLSQVCAEKKRYSFLLTSVPLNVPGLIGSPPNALAIF